MKLPSRSVTRTEPSMMKCSLSATSSAHTSGSDCGCVVVFIASHRSMISLSLWLWEMAEKIGMRKSWSWCSCPTTILRSSGGSMSRHWWLSASPYLTFWSKSTHDRICFWMCAGMSWLFMKFIIDCVTRPRLRGRCRMDETALSISESSTPNTIVPMYMMTTQKTCSAVFVAWMSPKPTVVNTVLTKYDASTYLRTSGASAPIPFSSMKSATSSGVDDTSFTSQ
mmetsp:Transcript_42262/g.99214  ORF Transcript_42262/g.99214 Transcript_42262/m.99214 type:complete len:224 (+) Transcript_42262:1518-2189(+)